MFPSSRRNLFGALATAAVLSAPMLAQNTNGSISGTVRDAGGAVVPGAVVTITNEETGVARTFKTSNSGVYTATTLNYGVYTVSIEAPGFAKQTVTKLTLHAYDALTVNGELKPGGATEEVSITADQLQLNLENGTVSGLLNGTQVKELVLNNRNYEQLLALQPGVVYGGTTDQLYIGTSLPGGTTATVAFSVSGNRSSTNNWTIDGTTNVDRGSNLTLLSYPSVDSIQEIKTLRNTYTAEYGGSVGGQVNVVIRSGTNKFHGTVYEFFRNDVLNANNYFNKLSTPFTPRPTLRYNDFGGAIGGPIWKDHTFFFFSGEYRRVINYASLSQNGVPTALERQGTFNAPVCTKVNIVSSTTATCATTGTQVTSIDPTAAAYVRNIFAPDGSKVLLPNAPALGPNYVVSNQRAVYNENQEVARIDHNLGQRLILSARMIYDDIPTVEPGGAFTGAQSLPGRDNTVNRSSTDVPGHNYLARATFTASPTLVLEGGYDYSYGAILSTPTGYLSQAASPDIKPTLPFASTLGIVPTVTMTSAVSLTSSGQYNVRSIDHNVFVQITKTLGRHTLITGATYHNYLKTENATGSNAGSFAFTNVFKPAGSTAFDYQQSFAHFLSGYAASFSQASVALTPKLHSNMTEAFLQDNWKVTPRLTTNAGVRYSYFGQPVDQNNLLDNFDPRAYVAANAPTIDTNGQICKPGAACAGGVTPNPNYDPLNGIILGNAANGAGFATAPNHQSPYGATVSPNKYLSFAPRLGFAYDLFGNGKTAVRGGFGIAFDSTLFGTYEQNSFANLPYVQSLAYTNVQFNNPAGSTPTTAATVSPSAVRGTDPNFRIPYTEQFSFGFQHEILKDLVLNADFVGNHGVHLQGIVDINQVTPGAFTQAPLSLSSTVTTAGVTTNRFTSSASELVLNRIRPYLGYNAINVVQTVFGSNYNSLQMQLQKRFKGANLVDVNYTYSKALTDNQTDRSTAVQDRTNPRGEYGPSQYDRRHVFTADFVYELPFFQSQQGLIGHLLGGFQFSGIVAVNSGLPVTISTSNLDPAGLGFLGASSAGGRPDQIGDPNKNAPHTRQQWFNTSAFAPVPVGVVRAGNARRGSVLGPGFQRWDLGFMRNFKIHEDLRLQFRAESFNTFNHTNWAAVFGTSSYTSQTQTSPSYGTITATRDPRIVQLALKLNF